MSNSANEKTCPFCGEKVRAEAIKCRFCGEFFDGQAPGGPSGAGNEAGGRGEVLFSGLLSRITLVQPIFMTMLGLLFAVGVAYAGMIVEEPGAKKPLLWAGVAIGVVSLIVWLVVWLKWKTRSFKVTNDRIEYEYGIISKTVLNMDLWRVRDIVYRQSFIERILGCGCVSVISSDQDMPEVNVGPIRNSRALYDRLKTVQLDADRRRGVMHIEQ